MGIGSSKYTLCIIVFITFSATYNTDVEDPYPSLSDFHDYEPNLEFDDSDLLQQKHPENDDGEISSSLRFAHFLFPERRHGSQGFFYRADKSSFPTNCGTYPPKLPTFIFDFFLQNMICQR